MSVSLKGFNTQIASFEADSAVTAGMAVGITANNKVAKATAAGGVAGVCVNVREGIAAIQLTGYVRVSYSGDTAPTVGFCLLTGDGDGNVKVVTSGGRSMLVTAVDTTAKTVDIIL